MTAPQQKNGMSFPKSLDVSYLNWVRLDFSTATSGAAGSVPGLVPYCWKYSGGVKASVQNPDCKHYHIL